MINKTYRLVDGGVITASTATEFVSLLHQSSYFEQGGPDRDYMISFAERYNQMHGVVLDTSTPESFLSSLIDQHYVQLIE